MLCFSGCKTKTMVVPQYYPYQVEVVKQKDSIGLLPKIALQDILNSQKPNLPDTVYIALNNYIRDSLPPTVSIPTIFKTIDRIRPDTNMINALKLEAFNASLEYKLQLSDKDAQIKKLNNRQFYIIIGFSVLLLALIGFVFYVLKKSSSLTKSLNIQSLQSIK